jgi:hypothetical protein
MVTKPTINLNGTSPGELLEQHLPAINGLRSAISTLRAAAPNARDYQTERLDAFALAMNEHRDRLARRESVMDELARFSPW